MLGCYNGMMQWCSNAMMLWCYDDTTATTLWCMGLWCYGAMMLWCHETRMLWWYDTRMLWCYVPMMLWYYDAMALWCQDAMMPWCYDSTMLCKPTNSPYCATAKCTQLYHIFRIQTYSYLLEYHATLTPLAYRLPTIPAAYTCALKSTSYPRAHR